MGRKNNGLVPWLESNSVLVSLVTGLLGGVIVVAFAWASIDSRIERLELSLESVSLTNADERCQAVLVRQIAAIEQNRTDLSETFRGLVQQHCRPLGLSTGLSTGEAMALEIEPSLENMRRYIERQAEARADFYRELASYDQELGLEDDRSVEEILQGLGLDDGQALDEVRQRTEP